eukprot:TRINITY_DN7049_c0_g2_i6.p1 TRINITY_DN7049_c0_g2~~TRINITY_DN7049_c0_g2_i6.p1  ORF type:complete len:282 (-),score=30.52 TRINITY_DN7049_c0_g2_i6:131-976(-)
MCIRDSFRPGLCCGRTQHRTETWPEGHRLASRLGLSFPTSQPLSLQRLIPNAPPEAIALMLKMMCFDPQKRLTAGECLEHDYFVEKLNMAGNLGFQALAGKGRESRQKSRKAFPVKALAPIQSFLNQPNDFSNETALNNQRFFKKLPNVRQGNSSILGNGKEFVSDYGIYNPLGDAPPERNLHCFPTEKPNINGNYRQFKPFPLVENRPSILKQLPNFQSPYESKFAADNYNGASEFFFKPPYYKQKPMLLDGYQKGYQPGHGSLPPQRRRLFKDEAFSQY